MREEVIQENGGATVDEVVETSNDTIAREGVKYSLRGTQLLRSGITTIGKALTDNMWIHSKVYSRGGDNEMHAHAREDHTFFVLQGSAEFTFAGGRKETVLRFDGVLIPKGAVHCFRALGDDNLVMLRVGSAQRGSAWSSDVRHGLPVEILGSLDANGNPITDDHSAQKGRSPSEPRIPLENRFFPEE